MIEADIRSAGSEWRTRRRLWIGLVVSLALNLFVVGVVAASFWRPTRTACGLTANLLAYTQTLPFDRRTDIQKLLASRRPALRPLHRQARHEHDRAVEALGAEPFDKGRFDAAHTRALDAALQQRRAGAE
ncbi:MAG: periplasmic heavy metal sensor, partial [Hyphomicrobiaceae bacterium]